MIAFNYLIVLILIMILVFMILSYASLRKIIKQNNESLDLANKSITDNQDQYKKNEALRKIGSIRANMYDELENLKYENDKIDNVIVYTNEIISKYNEYLKEAGVDEIYDFNDEKYRIIGIVNKYSIKEDLNREQTEQETSKTE